MKEFDTVPTKGVMHVFVLKSLFFPPLELMVGVIKKSLKQKFLVLLLGSIITLNGCNIFHTNGVIVIFLFFEKPPPFLSPWADFAH